MASPPIQKSIFAPLIALIDFAIVIGAGVLSSQVRFDRLSLPKEYQVLLGGAGLLLVFCLMITGGYDSWRGRRLLSLLKRYSLSLSLATGVLALFLVFTKTSEEFSRLWLACSLMLVWCGGVFFRCSHFVFLRRIRSSGKNLRRILIITPNPDHSMASFKAEELALSGYQVVGLITGREIEQWIHQGSLMGEFARRPAEEVWLDLPLSMGSFIKDIVYELRHSTMDIRFFPDFEDIQLLNHKVSSIVGHYAIDISCTPLSGFNRVVKRLEDILIGTSICILILPVCLLIATAIRLTSPGPVLFKQYRNGLEGRRFKVYKFRSMEVHEEAGGKVTQAQLGDPRVTRLGAFLRRTSLDELPQFFNVLQGRMSIVGPRPHALAHNEYYKDLVESYMWRHKVKPGITGLAQVRGYRGLTDTLEKMEKRVECDLEYINNWSLWLDLKIILQTTVKGIIHKNAF
ncbi:MAG: undecaprenyl-phosphate glucose phosphotransferase [Porticoccaceae bacterium]